MATKKTNNQNLFLAVAHFKFYFTWAGRAAGSDMGEVSGTGLQHQNNRELAPFSEGGYRKRPNKIFGDRGALPLVPWA